MAKLAAYKFISPPTGVVTPSHAAARKSVHAINRLGLTISGLGSVVSDIDTINKITVKNEKLREIAERRRRQRELDAQAEAEAEIDRLQRGKGLDKKPPKKAVKSFKDNLGLSWLERFLGPVGSFFATMAGWVVVKELLDWTKNEENIDKLKVFITKISVVFEKLAELSTWLTNTFVTGFGNLFGKESTLGERVSGLWDLIKGTLVLRLLFDPFGLLGDILFLLGDFGDRFNKWRNRNKKPKGPGADDIPTKPKPKPKPKKPWWKFWDKGDEVKQLELFKKPSIIENVTKNVTKAVDTVKNLGKTGITAVQDNLGKLAESVPKKGWLGNLTDWTKSVAGKGKDWLVTGTKSNIGKTKKAWQISQEFIVNQAKRFGNLINSSMDSAIGSFNKLKSGVQEKIIAKIIDPLRVWLEPLTTKVGKIGNQIINQIANLPGMKPLLGFLKSKFGVASLGDFAKIATKIGPKLIVGIGGLVNLLFSYERFRNKDSIGGVIEGVSGVFDLASIISGGAGSAVSSVLDLYMFARDLMPLFDPNWDLRKVEDGIVNKFGLAQFKGQIENITSKLPPLGAVSKFISGDEEALPEDYFFGGIVKSIGRAVSGVVKGVSKAVSGVVKGVGKVVSNPIVSTALSFIPGVGPVIGAINAATSLAQGNIMGAITGGLGALGSFANINTVNAISQPQWMQNLRFSKFGQGLANMYHGGAKIWGGLTTGFNNFMQTDIGKLGKSLYTGFSGGGWGGAVNQFAGMTGLDNTLSNIGNFTNKYGLSGIGNLFPGLANSISSIPALQGLPGISDIFGGTFSPMNVIGNWADRAGLSGLFDSITGMMATGDYMTGLRELAPELGVDPSVLGVYDEGRKYFTDGKFNAQLAVQNALEFVPVPMILKEATIAPAGVPINIGGGDSLSMSSLLNRLN